MKRNRRKESGSAGNSDIFRQVLSADYWEGFYALTNGNVAGLEDTGEDSAAYTVYDIRTGKKSCDGLFPFSRDTSFSALADEISAKTGSRLYLRISDMCQYPDRHEEVAEVFANPDRFELLRVQNLVKRLKNKGISIFGGRIGGLELEDGGCDGFFLTDSGSILCCRNVKNWDDGCVDSIVDGVISYRVLDPACFRTDSSPEHFFGYLHDDRFSSFMEALPEKYGRVMEILALEGDELFSLLTDALGGNGESAAIASHRLRMNLCISR